MLLAVLGAASLRGEVEELWNYNPNPNADS
jgi:hypothetical protein